MNLFESIRAATAEVVRGARYVRVVEDRLREYARSLPLEKLEAPKLDELHHLVGDSEPTIAFFLTLDAINFGSGYFPHLRKRRGLSGYFTVATSLNEHFRSKGPLSADQLENITLEACRELFQQARDDGPVDELMSLFATALNDLGRLVSAEGDGVFSRLVESADHSAERLARSLARMKFFHDMQRYDDRLDIPFYKRAQLTAADLNLALGGRGLGRFDDLHQLTIFADNLVPHVLRIDGVLCYDNELAKQIDNAELIPANSTQEIEIRAAAVNACERIVEELARSGRRVTAMQLDYLLWNRGQRPEYKAHPRHRARTVYY